MPTQILFPLLATLLFLNAAQAQEHEKSVNAPAPVSLTKEERAWLNKHKKIKIAYDGELPPYSFADKSGNIKGVAVEIVSLLAQRLGIQFETYPHVAWSKVYKDAVTTDKVDVVATMVNRPERLIWFNFTKPYINKTLVVVVRSDNKEISARSDINGKKVALFKDYKYINRVLKEFPKIKPVFVNSLTDGLQAVSKGKSEAAVIFSGAGYFLKNDPKYADLKIAAFYDYNIFNESMAVRKDWPLLATILQKGLDSISEEEKQNIFDKWVPPLPEADIKTAAAKTDQPIYHAQDEEIEPVTEKPAIPQHLLIKAAAAVTSALILLGLWTYALRRPGNRKNNRYHNLDTDNS
ncbi:MAG: hypothetical protein CTY18_04035 [Methylomonas sp.]|nr:MAG: hypothetical protein CTY18_04035 [Methylomonas sp.]